MELLWNSYGTPMSFANVAIAVPLHQLFTYKIPHGMNIEMGMRVLVPFRHHQKVGYVINTGQAGDLKTKDIIQPLDEEPIWSPRLLAFVRWISEYYHAPIGEVCRSAMPRGLNKLPRKKQRTGKMKETVIEGAFLTAKNIVLTPSQEVAYKDLKSQSDISKFQTILLHGITGSGKTELYLKCLIDVVAGGKQVLFLVPEIGLTPQLIGQVAARMGGDIAVYHSGLTEPQKLDSFWRIHSGDAHILIGTRSAVFAPFKDLKLIIVDEEHDPSYKQEESPRYNGRDAAVMRAKIEGIPCILGSATPSMESFNNAKTKKYRYIQLSERPSGISLPHVTVVDMREVKKGSALSPGLVSAIADTLKKKEQVMLFLNRRGFASFLICQDCGHTYTCPNCSISLVYHKNEKAMLCHYCDYKIAVPTICGKCNSKKVLPLGSGTEQIEDEIKAIFPHAKTARLDRDTAVKAGVRPNVLSSVKLGHTDILIGTQMITKGHDFPGVTLVGIINADTSLNFPDFRAAERTFQLVTQVAGRAGRANSKGEVIIQTYSPEHYAIRFAQKHDFLSFYNHEQKHRAELCYPPFGKLAIIRIQGLKEDAVEKYARDVEQQLTIHNSQFTILGPAPAPLVKVRNKYRWQLLIKSNSFNKIQAAIKHIFGLESKPPRGIQVIVDVDPINML